MPKISVIMPIYNTPANPLKESIDSILNQTFQDFELLLIDDGSQEYVHDIIKSYTDKRIVYIKNEKNSGLIYTLNRGLDIAQGDYIARMDSDDISLPERFAKQVAYLDEHPECGVLGTWVEVFPQTAIWKPYAHFTYFDLLKWNPFIIHPTVMIRSNVIRQHNIRYDGRFEVAEDYDFWRQLLHVCEIHNLQEVLFKYRMDGNNISIKRREQQKQSFQQIRQIAYDFLTEDEKLQKKLQIFIKKYKKRSSFKYRVKYLMYKTFWILSGKGAFCQTKMKQAKYQIKSLN